MGNYTLFNGKIKIDSKELLKFIQLQLKIDETGEEESIFPFDFLCEAKIKDKTLTIDQNERNYDDEIELVLKTISLLDKKAKGEVYYEQPDGGEKGKLILKNGVLSKSTIKEVYQERKVFKTGYDEKDYLPEIKELIEKVKEDSFCDECKTKLDLCKFDFEKRGYYDEIVTNTKYKKLCKKCYNEVKKPFAEKRRLEEDLRRTNEKLEKLKEKKL